MYFPLALPHLSFSLCLLSLSRSLFLSLSLSLPLSLSLVLSLSCSLSLSLSLSGLSDGGGTLLPRLKEAELSILGADRSGTPVERLSFLEVGLNYDPVQVLVMQQPGH